jgi:hypothetical protein
MAGHQHGSMDISAHQKTFHGFIKGVIWVVCLSFGALIFLALVNS